MRMNIREWSVRLGLYSPDQEVEWFGRDIGQPKDIPEFNQKAAWREIVPVGTADFQPTSSRADCIKHHILRLAQVFLGCNLLGQANTTSTVTKAELYFMWCMTAQRKVHLGYWIARIFHGISARASRHLNICHILGALFERCVEMSIVERIPRMVYCPKPEQFDTRFFTNVGILEQRSGKLRFYRVTQSGSQLGKITEVEKEEEKRTQPEATSPTPHPLIEATTPPTQVLIEATTPPTHARTADQVDEWRTRIERLLEQLAQNATTQIKLQTAQLELQMKHQDEMRTTVTTIQQMVIMLTRHLIPRQQGTSPSIAQGAGGSR